MHIVHLAAENDSLPGAKVGGVADVVRDIAPALGDLGHRVSVVLPSYGFLHRIPGAEWTADIVFSFWGTMHQARMYRVPAKTPHPKVDHYVIDHPLLEAGHGDTGQYRIYVHDPDDQPFFTDSSRFACFCSAAAAAVARGAIAGADVMHLHDWHMALVALLRQCHPASAPLQQIRTVFTIHNLGLQGIRPLDGSSSSLSAWFPDLAWQWLDVADPRWPDACNLMACGIRLADRVHTVSPSYAREICLPDDLPYFYGAQGLEAVLTHENQYGNLAGILNGCDYPAGRIAPVMDMPEMVRTLQHRIIQWAAVEKTVSSSTLVALHNLSGLFQRLSDPLIKVCSVTRLTEQKVLLMLQGQNEEDCALAQILTALGNKGVYFLLGTGHERFARFFTRLSARFPNFVFLNGFSDHIARILYANGDLFLMPSSFEPCGIGQMLAMRDGQPCVVHAVGGLRDTVTHEVNGFCFQGRDLEEQAQNFIDTFRRAVHLYENDPEKWQQIKEGAAETRFLWQDAAQQYLEKLYTA
ncbi:MAG TPA: glycogen/starch synthase [Desulfotignum sp.]|nr:glycogen/starch synthase [Desulfotignum sp.]